MTAPAAHRQPGPLLCTVQVVGKHMHAARVVCCDRAALCRRDIKDSDFARIMPKLMAHLQQRADYGPPSADPHAPPPGDFLPQWLLDEFDLAPWLEALAVVHAELGTALPAGARSRARRRLVFNETLLLSIMMLHHRVVLQSEEQDAGEAPIVCDNRVRATRCALAAVCPHLLAGQLLSGHRATEASPVTNTTPALFGMLRRIHSTVSNRMCKAFTFVLAVRQGCFMTNA